jgi:putative protease
VTAAARRPEVLAPAGAPECLPAAVAGGADAVYLGLRHFNARGRAENFRKADLPRHVAYLHQHGLKCYVVLNTLVHDDEHAKALDLAWHAKLAGVDAAIIQDLGLWRMLRRLLPGFELHASTQMTVHHPSQIAELAALGAKRVILARELSLPEIAVCAAEAARHGCEIEHFVHGALCYAFSGQCLMSNFAGCRSANRGTCAQNCRFVYTPATGGAGDTEISMRDLALIDQIGAMAEAGVASLKIEGRLKGPDYVFTVARAYREAVDAWSERRALDPAIAREPLADVFARPFTAAPLDGDYSAASRLHRADPVRDRDPDGSLVSLDRRAGLAVVAMTRRPEPGQGFAFSVGMFNDGFLVTASDAAGAGRWRCRVRVDPRGPRAAAGTPLFRNRDQRRTRDAATAMAQVPIPSEAQGGIPVDLDIAGTPGQPLRLCARTADGREAQTTSTMPLAAATGKPLDATQLRTSAGALGGSGFLLRELAVHLDGACFLPASELKRLRRELVERLAALPAGSPPAFEPPAVGEPRRRTTGLWVVVGSADAARAAFDAGAARVVLDDATLDLWGAVPPTLGELPAGTWLRLPATAPPSPHLATLGLPVLAGHLGQIASARAAGVPVAADLFLNTYSTETLAALRDSGAQAAVLSLELSGREVARLAARVGGVDGPELAVVAHGRVPSMLTRQDHGLAVGAVGTIQAVPEEGGLPYELQRRRRDTVVWEGRRLCAPEPTRSTAGLVDWWLLELADLAPAGVTAITRAYAALRDGALEPAGVETAAAPFAAHGFFTGHLVRGARELDEIADQV